MKTASPALVALLAGNSFFIADLFTFTCLDGTALRYTTTDRPVAHNGFVFSNTALRIDGFKYKLTLGTNADEMTLTVSANPGDYAGAIPFFQRILNGGFDGTRVRVERLFSASPDDPSAGTVEMFTGRVSDISDTGRTKAVFKIKSDLELLDIQMPRNTYQPSCIHTLYDAGCTAVKGSFGGDYSVGADPTLSAIAISGSGAADGYYDMGTVAFTSGPNAGSTRTIRQFAGSIAHLAYPLPSVPVHGDLITVYAGCDKTAGTCADRFGNLANWRAFPYIPQPETAY
jgi:uncharacterized phage protein (TIGR02218 family)